jgi:hypothetical protein
MQDSLVGDQMLRDAAMIRGCRVLQTSGLQVQSLSSSSDTLISFSSLFVVVVDWTLDCDFCELCTVNCVPDIAVGVDPGLSI